MASCTCCAGNGYYADDDGTAATAPPCTGCGHPEGDHDEDAGPGDEAWRRIHDPQGRP